MSDDAAKTGEAIRSDLGVRAASAVVMIAVVGLAIWAGGLVFTAFAAAVALGVLWEWNRLAGMIAQSGAERVLWLLAGIVYVGAAVAALVLLREFDHGMLLVGGLIALVAAIDIGPLPLGEPLADPRSRRRSARARPGRG